MIRRSLNIPVVAVTLAGLAAAASGFHFVRQWQLTRLARTFLDRAQVAEARADWFTAAEDLDRYLHFEPGHSAIRWKLAEVFSKGANTLDEKRRAVTLHYRALSASADGDTIALRVRLAELLLQTKRFQEAEGEARNVLQSQPGNAQALRVLALARCFQWQNGELSSARPQDLALLRDVESAFAANPGDLALAEVGAKLYRDCPAIVKAHARNLLPAEAQKRADAFLDRAVDVNPGDAEAWLARHLYRVRYGLPDAAALDLQQALKVEPEHPQVLLVASECRYQAAKEALKTAATEHLAAAPLAECKEHLTTLIEKQLAPSNVQPYLRLGDAYVLEGALDQAVKIWQDALAKFSQPTTRVALHARIADHLLRAGQIAEARPSLDAIQQIVDELGGTIRRQDHLTLMQAQELRQATFDLCHGRYSDAIGKLQRAIAQQPQLQPNPQTSHTAWDLLARAHAGLQDWSVAATAFDRAANFLPAAFQSRQSAAEAWLAAGRTDLAIDRAEQIAMVEPKSLLEPIERQALAQAQPGAWLVLATAELQVQAGRPPAQRIWTRLEAALRELEQIRQGGGFIAAPWRIDFLQADFLALQSDGDADENRQRTAAAAVLRQAEARYQDRPEFWFQACLAYERLSQPQDAERAWQRLNQMPGAQTEATIAAARRAAAHDDFGKAASILESAAPSLPLVAQERLRQELIRLAQAKQDLPRMQALFEATLRERPQDVGALCGLAELALRAGDFSRLAEWEAKLAKAGTAGELWAQYFGITRLYSLATGPGDPKLAEALAAQARLATLRPNWADTYSLRGAIEQRLENWEAAIAAYEQAVQLGERRFAVIEQLIACLDRMGRFDEIDRHLARVQAYLPASQRLTELASSRQLDCNRPQQAIAIAQRALAQRPGDISARLWLGRLLLMTDRLAEAKVVFEKATQDAPHEARSWSGLFSYYHRAGDYEQARQTLQSLERHAQLPADKLDLVLGRGYQLLGDSTHAIKRLMRVIESGQEVSKIDRAAAHLQIAQLLLETDREEAKSHLRAALELDSKLAQARWLLATLLAVGGSEDELAVAEQLLSQTGGEATVEDRRLRAVLLAQHRGDKGLVKAIEMLERMVADNADSVTDRLLLAQFLERRAAATTDAAAAQELVNAARDQFAAVANRQKATVADWGVLVNFLLRHDQKTAAADWLDRLETRVEQQTKADPKAIALLIDLRLAQGAVKRCEPWLAKLDAADRDPLRPLVARVRYYAALPLIEAIGPAVEAKAGPLYQAAKSPQERTRIARTIGDLYLLVRQLAGAELWYRKVLKADPQQFEPLARALLHQGRGPEAIRLCQTAADSDQTSRTAVILTNLLLEAGAKHQYVQQAEPILADALRRFPNDVNLLYGVGMVRVFEDRYEDAMALLQKVVRLSPQHIPALNNLAVLVAESDGTRPEGLTLIDRAIAHRGHQPTLLDTKGTILMWAGQTSEAVTLLEAAARGSTTDPRHSFHLALAYSELGAKDHARQELDVALKNRLETQILTPTDRKALSALRQSLDRPESKSR